jgi:hypothetical protein
MRIALAACLVLLALAGPVRAQANAQFYVGAWRDIPSERPPARRVVLHHIEIAQIASLRTPRRFSVHIWLRCQDHPADACEFRTVGGVERVAGGNTSTIYVELNPRLRGALRPCQFNLLLVPAYIPSEPANPESSKTGIEYRIIPPGGPCAASEFSGIVESGGLLEPMLVADQPIEPARPTLPRPRF